MSEQVRDQDVEFVAAIKRLRQTRGMSQAAVAVGMVDQGFPAFQVTTMSKIERGERRVSIGEAAAIARVLDVTLDELVNERDEVGTALARHRAALRRFQGATHELLEALGRLMLAVDEADEIAPHAQRAARYAAMWETPASDAALSSGLSFHGVMRRLVGDKSPGPMLSRLMAKVEAEDDALLPVREAFEHGHD